MQISRDTASILAVSLANIWKKKALLSWLNGTPYTEHIDKIKLILTAPVSEVMLAA
jgi:hypothetical protein